MQDAIPAIPETPIVSMIPQLSVGIGQNQVRRTVGLYTGNYQGVEAVTRNIQLQPGTDLKIDEYIRVFSLSASAPIELLLQYFSEPAQAWASSTTINQLVLWDQLIEKLRIFNRSDNVISIQLNYVRVDAPLEGGEGG